MSLKRVFRTRLEKQGVGKKIHWKMSVEDCPLTRLLVGCAQDNDVSMSNPGGDSCSSSEAGDADADATPRPPPPMSPLPPLQLFEPAFPPDKKSCPDLARTHEWDAQLAEPGFLAAPVSCFNHVSCFLTSKEKSLHDHLGDQKSVRFIPSPFVQPITAQSIWSGILFKRYWKDFSYKNTQ